MKIIFNKNFKTMKVDIAEVTVQQNKILHSQIVHINVIVITLP